jgi:hypothetical protein
LCASKHKNLKWYDNKSILNNISTFYGNKPTDIDTDEKKSRPVKLLYEYYLNA